MSQVNFFMLEADEEQFLEMLSRRKDTALYPHGPFQSSHPQSISTVSPFGTRQSYTLLLSSIASPPDEKSRVYSFGLYTHPIIEYSRSYFHNDTLVSGRIYAKIGWGKSPENNRLHRAWYTSIERWLKKRYQKVHKIWWVAPEAQLWSLKGGLLALGSPLAMKISLGA